MNTLNEKPFVNWTDGMKLNKDIFIAHDDSVLSVLFRTAATHTSEIRYGLLPEQNNFSINITPDNQNVISIQLSACKAITQGGAIIDLSVGEGREPLSVRMPVNAGAANTVYWAVVESLPFSRTPFGEVDTNESPARLPFARFDAKLHLIEDHELNQYLQHPLSMPVGKIYINGSSIRNDEEYIPPCFCTQSSADLVGLQSELDSFLSSLELACSQIVQKIYRKSQQNDLSELAQFLCDRIMLFLAPAITHFRTSMVYESPIEMIKAIASLARIIKNTIDLRIGSGKDELMNYLCEWCELNQGELEQLLTQVSVMKYKHYDINENITTVVRFAKIIGKLFTTLSNLEFIGKKKEAGLFVKEETSYNNSHPDQPKPKRRFFG